MTTTISTTNIVPRTIRVIGVPLDLGQSRRGVDMGPSAVRVAGLEARLEALGHEVEDGGNVAVAIPEQKKEGDAHAKYLKEITSTCTKHAELVVKTLEAGKIPLALGGDHSMAAGTVSGVAEFYRRQNQRIGLICAWDAAGRADGAGSGRTVEHLRVFSQGEAGKLCAGGSARH
jgi:arginase